MAKRRLTIRLDSEKERDSEIISYLDSFDKKELRTINNAVLNAVYEFLKNRNKDKAEDNSSLISEIRKAVSEEISKFFFPLFGGLMNNMNNNSFGVSEKEEREKNPAPAESDISDFDADFMGG